MTTNEQWLRSQLAVSLHFFAIEDLISRMRHFVTPHLALGDTYHFIELSAVAQRLSLLLDEESAGGRVLLVEIEAYVVVWCELLEADVHDGD